MCEIYKHKGESLFHDNISNKVIICRYNTIYHTVTHSTIFQKLLVSLMKTEVHNQFCNNSSDNFGLWLPGLEAKCGPSLLLTRVSRKLLVKWARGESCSRLVNWGDTTQGWFYFRLHPCFFVDFSINACCSWGYTIQDDNIEPRIHIKDDFYKDS